MQLVGNLATDANSAKKYYYFIRLMGRAASHITQEVALQTHPNVTLLGEELEGEFMRVLESECACENVGIYVCV